MKKTVTLSLLTSLILTSLQAQTIELDEVTVEAANRTSQNIKDLTESVTIISAQDIKESGITSLNEALLRLGNITTVSNGGPGQNSSFLLRGMSSRNTLVLIDGVRYNDVTGLSGAQFSQIRLADVEKIEIIKGAQSGIWGSDASAGVINIVTKQAKDGLHLNADFMAGSFNTQEGSLQGSYKTDLFDIVLGISRFKTDGFSAAEPNHGTPDYGQRGDDLGYEDDAHINNTYNIKLGLNITDEDRIETRFKRINSFTEYDGSSYDFATGTYQSTDAQNYDDLGYGLSTYFEEIDNRFYSAEYTHTDDVNELSLQYNYSYFNRKVSGYKGNTQEVSLQDRFNYAKDSFIRIGGSYQDFEHEDNYGAEFDKSYTDKAVYATNYNKFAFLDSLGETIFTQSLRFDDYNAFNSKTTGKVGLKQFVHNDIYISSNYGTGYNAPSMYQLYAPAYFGSAVGNENLAPEESKTFDISIGNNELTLTYFHNEIKNLIEYDFLTGYQNVAGTSKIKGLEVGYKNDFFDLFALNINYTFLDAKNANDEFLRSRPKHQMDGNLFYYISDALNIGLNAQYIGERYDEDNRKGAQTGKYSVFNAIINYTINKKFSAYVKVDNLGNKYYQIRDGYATAERSYYAGLSAQF